LTEIVTLGNVDTMLMFSITCGAFFVLLVVCMLWQEPKRWRLRKRLDEEEWMLCPKCEQGLRGIQEVPDAPGMVRCPECGEACERAHLPDLWKERLYPKLPPGSEES
jgi:hypothetical protein